MYAPLWCKSNYSFLEGASHPQELVEEAHRLGLRALSITDRDGMYGIVRAWVRAKELGVHLIVGSEMTLNDGTTLVLLAQDRAGYGRVCRLVTQGRMRSPKGQSVVTYEEVCERAEGVIALWGGDRSRIVEERELEPWGAALRDAFGDRLYAMVARHRRAEERRQERRLRERAERLGLPLVAATEVLYHMLARRPLQDVLTCVRHGVAVNGARSLLKPNAEHGLSAPFAFARLFEDLPGAVERTVEIADRCGFRMDQLHYVYPSEKLPDGTTTAEWLRRLTFDGARVRYPEGVPSEVTRQLEKELALIEELDYGGYFLTMWEIVEFCRENGILCQGRGSAANSAVCFCLRITAVDPVRMDLLFERFLSKERAEPPDVDLDVQHGRREEVIQWIYAKYGRERAAMVANVVRYRPRSAVRDLGKALGFPETSLDRFAKLLGHYGGAVDPDVAAQSGLDPRSPSVGQLIELADMALDFPRHLSIHPGGFLLGHDPVCELVPIENASMEDRTVIQWDKEDVEDMGLFKVDILGLGALTHLDLCFKLLREHRGVELSMATLPHDDRATFAMMGQADTVGVFQIESRAQMAMLPRLQPRTFYDLVIEISIVRPGPISGGMVHPYLRRRNGEEPVVYPHECLAPVLDKTLGVPLFQEQVMKLAVVAADYTPGEADRLRRDMAAWRRGGRIEHHHARLVDRMKEKGIAEEFAERVFEQIRGFGEYGFPESHAASFALISWATSYLKCHYPSEFTCGILNAWPMGFYSPATLVDDAKRHGVEIRPVCVQASDWECTLEPAAEETLAVRMGFRYVKGLEVRAWERLQAVRDANGPFRSLQDVADRTRLGLPVLLKLAETGAFEAIEPDRRQALWSVRRLTGLQERPLAEATEQDDVPFAELTPAELVGWDYATAIHSSRGHPLQAVRDQLHDQGLPDAQTLWTLPHGRKVRYVGAVICRQRPGTAKGVTFFTLEDETGFVNLVVWKDTFERYALVLKTASVLGVSGRLESQNGTTHLIVDSAWTPKLNWRPVETASRDFH
ncbi:MAG: error-prone DNA polymerase [Planctomycetes bacterium]|nr:error-prone DNA polymerase [Planctomycetota bacterium]